MKTVERLLWNDWSDLGTTGMTGCHTDQARSVRSIYIFLGIGNDFFPNPRGILSGMARGYNHHIGKIDFAFGEAPGRRKNTVVES